MGVYLLSDLDNCLVDNMEYFPLTAQLALRELKVTESIQNIKKKSLDHYREFAASYGLDFDTFIKVWDIFDNIKARKKAIEDGMIKLFPDTIPVLEKLVSQGFELGIISNTPVERAMLEIEMLGLEKFFKHEAISCYDYNIRSKPEPDLAFRALEGLNYQNGTLIWIMGDTKQDVESGNRLRELGYNAKTIYINRHNIAFDSDYEVESLTQAYSKIQNGSQKRG